MKNLSNRKNVPSVREQAGHQKVGPIVGRMFPPGKVTAFLVTEREFSSPINCKKEKPMSYLSTKHMTKSEKVAISKTARRENESSIYLESLKILAVAISKGVK